MNLGEQYFLGFDCSTQSLKCTIVDKNQKVIYSNGVNYGKELPSFNTTNGIVTLEDGSIVTPTLLWVAAYDLLLSKMSQDNVDFSKIKAISASGQQHGSVYWKTGALQLLQHLDSSKTLESQLKDAFSIPYSPIWMDSTTHKECLELEEKMGGCENVAQITGSRAYERFTGNQIAKLYKTQKENYMNTERISLVSSFSVSLFLGNYAEIDISDGSGMNLLDIHTKQWNPECLEICASDLKEKLGNPVNSWEVLGPISSYFVERYHFSKDCLMVPGSGDNNCSLTALNLVEEGQIGVSLGTSNTFFGVTATPHPGKEGHVFASPIDPKTYMCMLCYKNGDFVRSEVNNEFCAGDWEVFSTSLHNTTPGNNGFIVIKLNEPEITPHIMKTGLFIWDDQDHLLQLDTSEQLLKYKDSIIRGIIEYQFMSIRIHSESIGVTSPTKLIATGGASNNKQILQILSNIFNCPVYVISQTDSASLGASYRALHGFVCHENHEYIPYDSILTKDYLSSFSLSNEPDSEAYKCYSELIERYKKHEIELEQMN